MLLARVLLGALACLVLCSIAPLAVGDSTVVVESGSMSPTLAVGDLVVVQPTAEGRVSPGEIVTVHNPAHPGRLLLHRVETVGPDGTLTTKGDANLSPDSTPVPARAVVGRAVLRIPALGLVSVWAKNGQLWALLLVALLGLGVGAVATTSVTPYDGRHGAGREARPPRPQQPRRRSARVSGLARTRAVVGITVLSAAAAPFTAGRGPAASAAFVATAGNAGNSWSATGTFPTYPQAVLADSASAYYRGDDAAGSATAADSSGNGNPGTYVSTTPSFQQAGSPAGGPGGSADTGILLPGGASGATAASATSMSAPTTLTTEVWFKTTSTSQSRLVAFGDHNVGESFYTDRVIYLRSNGQLSYYVGSTVISSSTTGYNDGAWHLVSASLGAAGIRLYADGALVAADPSVTTGQTYTGYWRIGGDYYDYLAGSLDEAAIYSTQLADSRIAAHYSSGASATSLATYTATVTADAPWALWHLDDPPLTSYRGSQFATPMADSSGQSHPGFYYNLRPLGISAGLSGALIGVSSSSTAIRYAGSGIGYDPVATTNPTTFSLELWFRSSSGTGGKLIGMGNVTTGSSGGFDRQIYLRDSGQLTFGIFAGSAVTVTSPLSYTNGSWHHVAATFGATNGERLYVDGALVASNSSPGTPQSYTGYWRWGGDNLGGGWPARPTSDYVNSDLDEIAIYPTELSAQQVAWHYHANH